MVWSAHVAGLEAFFAISQVQAIRFKDHYAFRTVVNFHVLMELRT